MKKYENIIVWIDNNDEKQITEVLDLAVKLHFYPKSQKQDFKNELLLANYEDSYIRFNINGRRLTYGSKDIILTGNYSNIMCFNSTNIHNIEHIIKFGDIPNYKPRSKR